MALRRSKRAFSGPAHAEAEVQSTAEAPGILKIQTQVIRVILRRNRIVVRDDLRGHAVVVPEIVVARGFRTLVLVIA